MKKLLQEYIDKKSICTKTDRILVGVSGGIDSVCLLHLLHELEYRIAIAHCNFQLRSEESDQDELFVRNLSEEYSIPFYSTQFETKEIAQSEGISIQMAARDLRYEWFEEIRMKHGYDYIAIAHNKNDVSETFLTNLTRGTGIKGLTGIKEKSGNIIRPLLFAGRTEIENYITIKNLDYREDSSNKTTKYSRNLIRHEIIPLFEKINPRFQDTLIENMSRLKETEAIYLQQINSKISELTIIQDDLILIEISKLKELKPLYTYLFELLNPLGFSKTQINDIIDALDSTSGKQFFSLTHRILKDRNYIIITEISAIKTKSYFIDLDVNELLTPIHLEISKYEKTNAFEIIKDKNIGLFDLDLIDFPLTLRKWQKGDYFMPLGMSNLKKVSDFFIDQKLSILEKEDTWILESNNKIVWIIGYRIDERFKISDNTKNILKIARI